MLYSILRFATETVPYYRDLGLNGELSRFPVVNKEVIKQEYGRFRSDAPDLGRLTVASTSGSTGVPFKLLHDERKQLFRQADTIHFGRLAGYEVGVPLYYLKIWSARNRKSWVQQRLTNVIPVDVMSLHEQGVKHLLERLQRDRRRKVVAANVSALDQICKVLDADPDLVTRVNLRIDVIIAQGEALSQETATRCARYLGALPVVHYGMEEVGIIAQTPRGGGDFIINTSGVMVEVLEIGSNLTVAPGELGRLVVTDLRNRAMPLIRYDTGDLGVASMRKGRPALSMVTGRKMDRITDPQGRYISNELTDNIYWKYPEMQQFQFAQQGPRDYVVRLKTTHPEIADSVVRDFRDLLGMNARVTCELVETIPLPPSGKLRMVVNERPG